MSGRGRTIMYFDNSNIFRSQKQAGWKIDAHKLNAKLQQAGDIWQTYFFAAVTDPPRYRQTNFYNMLKNDLRWETVIFPLGRKTFHCNACGASWSAFAEKGVDVAIASKMLTHAINRAFDTAILLSGDKDYLETVKTVKNQGLRIEIAAFRASLSADLARESSTSVLVLDDIRNEIEWTDPEAAVEELQSPE